MQVLVCAQIAMTLPGFMFTLNDTVMKVKMIETTVCGHHVYKAPYISKKSCHFNVMAIAFTTSSL